MDRQLLHRAPEHFHTPRLRIEKIRVDHADALLDAVHRAGDNWRFIEWAGQGLWDREHAQMFCSMSRMAMEQDGAVLSYVVSESRRDADPWPGRFVGMIDLHSFQPRHRHCQVGYVCDVAMQGRGLMREAVSAVVDLGLTRLQMQRIEAWCDPLNLRSIRFARSLGFEPSETLSWRRSDIVVLACEARRIPTIGAFA